MDTNNNSAVNAPIKRTVLDYNDIVEIAPQARGHEKLVNRVLHWLSVDKVNDVHDRYCDKPGPEFARNLLKDFDINLRIDGKEVLDNLPEGAFITVSNHPFGALDGISLIAMMGSIRPSFKVMVNMVLNHISAMRPNFIAVDALASDDPAKKAVSMKGIKEAIMQVRRGNPIGFFPAGAVSKINGKLRTLRLPAEVWRKCHTTIHVSVGDIITPEEQKQHESVEALGTFLKSKTYELRDRR